MELARQGSRFDRWKVRMDSGFWERSHSLSVDAYCRVWRKFAGVAQMYVVVKALECRRAYGGNVTARARNVGRMMAGEQVPE